MAQTEETTTHGKSLAFTQKKKLTAIAAMALSGGVPATMVSSASTAPMVEGFLFFMVYAVLAYAATTAITRRYEPAGQKSLMLAIHQEMSGIVSKSNKQVKELVAEYNHYARGISPREKRELRRK